MERLSVILRDGTYIGVGWTAVTFITGDPLFYFVFSWFLAFKYRKLACISWCGMLPRNLIALAIDALGIKIGYALQYSFFWN